MRLHETINSDITCRIFWFLSIWSTVAILIVIASALDVGPFAHFTISDNILMTMLGTITTVAGMYTLVLKYLFGKK